MRKEQWSSGEPVGKGPAMATSLAPSAPAARSLGETELPWEATVLGGGKRGSACTTVVTGDQDDVRAGLGYTGSNRTHAVFSNELHSHACLRVDF